MTIIFILFIGPKSRPHISFKRQWWGNSHTSRQTNHFYTLITIIGLSLIWPVRPPSHCPRRLCTHAPSGWRICQASSRWCRKSTLLSRYSSQFYADWLPLVARALGNFWTLSMMWWRRRCRCTHRYGPSTLTCFTSGLLVRPSARPCCWSSCLGRGRRETRAFGSHRSSRTRPTTPLCLGWSCRLSRRSGSPGFRPTRTHSHWLPPHLWGKVRPYWTYQTCRDRQSSSGRGEILSFLGEMGSLLAIV